MPTHPEAPAAERASRVPDAASSERGSVSRSTSACLSRFQSAAGDRPALRPGARASARFTVQSPVASKTNSTVTNIGALKRRERRAPAASPLSLTPGFSPVWHVRGQGKLFQQFSRAPKPLKRFLYPHRLCTGLKPGVNEYLNPFGIHFGLRRQSAAATALSHARSSDEFSETFARSKSGVALCLPPHSKTRPILPFNALTI
jgi:hypothetical protein